MKFSLLWLLLLALLMSRIESCTNDTHCITCNFYVVTLIPLSGFFGCGQCQTNRQYNSNSGFCECSGGFYQKQNGECSSCPSACNICASSSQCTECTKNNSRELKNGQCVCVQGYEQVAGKESCQEKTNILLVVLSSIGSILCMIIGSVVCVVLRYRRNSQVHTQNQKKKKKNSSNMQVEVYEEDPMENSGVFFYSGKHQDFKQNETCSICLDINTLFVTDCGHYFHGKCIYNWLQNKDKCPNCNKEIKTKDIRRWCQRCKKNLMKVVKTVVLAKSGKKKKQIIKSTPIQHQICDTCENQSSENEVSQEKFAT